MIEPPFDIELVAALREKIRKHKPCKGYGHVIKDGKMQVCECKAEAEFQYRLARSGIPPRFRRMGFKDYAYKESAAYAQMQGYLSKAEEHRRDGIGMYLFGPSYTGKSLLACSLIAELMRRGYDCKYMSFDGLLDSHDRQAEQEMDSRWDFLVIDRVGDVLNRLTNFRQAALSGDTTHGAVEYLTSLVSRRANSGRPLIMPSTATLSELDARFPSLAGALIGTCLVVECQDQGFRQKRIGLMMDPEGR